MKIAKTSKPALEAKVGTADLDQLMRANIKACYRLCGKGACIYNPGWFVSPNRIESKVANSRGWDYLIVSIRKKGLITHWKVRRQPAGVSC